MTKLFVIPLNLVILTLIYSTSGEANVDITTVPEEFRTLWTEQDEMVEVYFYGTSLGVFHIRSTPDNIRFYDPQKIIDRINVKPTFREDVLRFLSVPLPRNGNLSCPDGNPSNESGCGFIRTDKLSVIFDENNGILNLFIKNDFLSDSIKTNDIFWTPTATENAFIHSQSLNISDNRTYQSLFASGLGALGVTSNSYLIADWQFSYLRNKNKQNGDQGTRNTHIRDIYYRYDIARRYYVQTGRMDATDLFRNSGGDFNFSLLPVPSVDGVRIGTTQSYLRPSKNSTSTPVTVLLNRFSRIEVYRNNQLIGTFYLDSGIRQLDTQTFPDGSYTLDLRFFEEDRLVRTEMLPFSKWNGLAGSSLWNFFLQGGKITTYSANNADMEKKETSVLTGVRLPLGRGSVFQQGLSFLSDKKYAESRLDWGTAVWDGSFNLSVAGLWGSDNVTGNSESISYNDGFSLSFYHQQRKGTDVSGDRSDYLNWMGNNETYNTFFSFPLLLWQTSLGYNYTTNNSKGYLYCYYDCDNYTPSWQMYRGKSRTWQINTSRSFLWDNWSVMPSLGIYYSRQDSGIMNRADRGGYFTLTMTRNDNISDLTQRNISTGYTLNHTRSGGSRNDVYIDSQWVRNTELLYQELETRVNGGNENYGGMIRGRINNRFGDLNGSFSISKNKSFSSDSSVTLLYNSSLALNRQGITWGGNASGINNLAGNIITVEAEPHGAPLVQIGGGQTVGLDGGQRSLVPVTALTETEITLNEVATGDVNVNLSQLQNSKQFIVPGHVYSRTVSAQTTWTYIGRALDPQRKPLGNAVILNSGAVRLDDDGGFSFEHDRKDSFIYLLKDKTIYTCQVKAERRKDALMLLGTVICEKSSEDHLPQHITQQTRVQDLLARGQ